MVPTTKRPPTTAAPRCINTEGWASINGHTCATYELGFNDFGLEPERLCTAGGSKTDAFDRLMAAIDEADHDDGKDGDGSNGEAEEPENESLDHDDVIADLFEMPSDATCALAATNGFCANAFITYVCTTTCKGPATASDFLEDQTDILFAQYGVGCAAGAEQGACGQPAVALMCPESCAEEGESIYALDDDADADDVTADQACCTCGGGAPEPPKTTVKPTTAAPRDSIPCSSKKTDIGTECVCDANCHTCTVGSKLEVIKGQCSKCKNSQALFAGNCVSTDACEAEGGSVQGTGKFSRTCNIIEENDEDAKVPVCKGKATEGSSPEPCTCPRNCHTCQGQVCLLCKNKQVLVGDQCVESSVCTDDNQGQVAGTGNFGRRCVGATTAETTKPTTSTTTACPSDGLEHFDAARVEVRLKKAADFVFDDGKIPKVEDAGACADSCIKYGNACKAFELKVRGGQLRCNLLRSSASLGTSIVASEKYDLYDRSRFCDRE